MYKVSVIIPLYNVEEYIDDCLNSVVNQSLDSTEIICIDDCSTDSSVTRVKRFVEENSNVKLYQQKKRGTGAARNLGIEKSDGEYICFMDADDYYPNNNVLYMLYSAAKRTNALLCGGNILNQYNDRCEQDSTNFATEGFVNSKDEPRLVGQTRFIYKSSLIKDNHILYPPYIRFEDPPFVLESIMRAGSYYTMTECVYVRRTGYKGIVTDINIARGIAKGILRCAELAKEFNLVNFFKREIVFSVCDAIGYFAPYISDNEVVSDLQKVKDISISLCGENVIPFQDQNTYTNFLNSVRNTISICQSKKKIVVYGAGKTAKELIESGYIRKEAVLGIAVTNNEEKRYLGEYSVRNIEEYVFDKNNISIIIATNEKHILDIEERLVNLGFMDYVSVPSRTIYIAKTILKL